MSKLNEEWRPVVAYEGLYEVSDWGNVRSLNYNKTKEIKELKQIPDKDGYMNVCLHKYGSQLSKRVHRLVADSFIPNPDNKPCIDHINGKKDDNRVENLRWATVVENNRNPVTMKNMIGIQNGRQLNRKDCSKPVYQYTLDGKYVATYPSASEAARVFNCHKGTIAKCCVDSGRNNKALNYKWYYELQ